MRNAIDAVAQVPRTNDGTRARRIRVMTLRADDRFAQVIINDSGPGIPADLIPQLFEPFFTTKSSGMGIGLLVCKSIIDDHEGTIRSRIRRGARNDGLVYRSHGQFCVNIASWIFARSSVFENGLCRSIRLDGSKPRRANSS